MTRILILASFSSILLGINSCDNVSENQVVKIVEKESTVKDYLTGYSNKIWVLKKHTVEEQNNTPANRDDKLFFGFYGDGMFRLGPINSINQFDVYKGRYVINEKENIIIFQFENAEIGMDERKLVEVSHHKLIISSLGGEEVMEFEPIDKPLPEDVLSL